MKNELSKGRWIKSWPTIMMPLNIFIHQNNKNNKSNILHRITTLYTIFQQIFLLENTLVFSFRQTKRRECHV